MANRGKLIRPAQQIGTVANKPKKITPIATRIMQSLRVNTDEIVKREDVMTLLEYILSCNEMQLDDIERNPITPVVILTFVKGIKKDLKNGNTEIVSEMMNRIYGKASQKVELTAGADVVPDKFMTREDYMNFLRKASGDMGVTSQVLEDIPWEEVGNDQG